MDDRNQDWSRLGEEVKDIVQSAVESRDFQELNKAIEKTAMSALTFHKHNATGCLSQRENYSECRARQCPMAM